MRSFEQFLQRMEEVETLLGLVPPKPTRENVRRTNSLTRAAVVLLCSHLEGFIQDILKEFVIEINKLDLAFRELPLEIYVQHAFPKGQLPQKGQTGILQVLKEFQTIDRKNGILKLDWKQFNKTEGNPSPETINRIFRVIGEEAVLDRLNLEFLNITIKEERKSFLSEQEKKLLLGLLGDSDSVEKVNEFLTERRHTKTETRDVGFYFSVNRLLEVRNMIAHGKMSKNVSVKDITDLTKDIRKLAYGLSNIVENRVHELSVQAATLEVETPV